MGSWLKYQTNSVFYFGEDTKKYENGKGVGAKKSLGALEQMTQKLEYSCQAWCIGGGYQEETAPYVATDMAEIISLNETLHISAGNFDDPLRIKETTPL